MGIWTLGGPDVRSFVRSLVRTDGNPPLCSIGHRPLRVRCPKTEEDTAYGTKRGVGDEVEEKKTQTKHISGGFDLCDRGVFIYLLLKLSSLTFYSGLDVCDTLWLTERRIISCAGSPLLSSGPKSWLFLEILKRAIFFRIK